MKVYTKREDLSRAVVETAQEIFLPVLLLVDFRAVPCFVGMAAGLEMPADKLVFAWFFAAQIVAVAILGVIALVKAIRRARMPRRYGVIPAAAIRKMMGGEHFD